MSDQESRGVIRVLLADDHAVVRAGIRQFLERSGRIQVVAEAGDGLQACEMIAKDPPDVAVFDIQMPLRSGIEAARWVRANRPAVGVLVLTAYDDEPYVQAALRAGANGYVLKTAGPDEIVRAVEDVYQGKAVLDAALAQRLITRLTGQPAAGLVEPLTERELEILTLAGKGLTNKAIGVSLHISDRTVQNHLAHIFQKLQAASRTEAVMRAVSLGLLPPDLADPQAGA
jgi:DNA-binding NarL/FixJ family response regulator